MIPHHRPCAAFGAVCAALLVATLSGCGSIGPKAVPRDRIDYAGAIGDSWKQQTLLNIVKLRYADFPVFLDINQVIAGYEFNSSATAGFNASSSSYENPAPSFLTLGGSVLLQGGYKDQPTVLYTPSTGSDFITRLMTPIPPSAVLFLLQAGYAADRVLRLTLDSINGISNESNRRIGATREADPRFVRLGQLISEMQVAGALEVRILRPKDGAETSIVVFRPGTRDPALEAKRREIAEILGLKPDPEEINVYYGGYSGRDNEIAMLTRSMLQIMLELGFFAEVPETDIKDGKASPSAIKSENRNPLQIMSGDAPPQEAFVSVPYHGHWFWIPDTDLRSKSTFGSVMLLFSISDVGAKGGAPVVTVPTK
ncbi:MAG: hypothetical protein R3D05_13060 [Dongiaceae bacterium]